MVSERYPKIRQTSPDGRWVLREGLVLCFFMRRSHDDLSRSVTRALECYLDAVGHEKLGWYVDMGGDLDPGEYKGWAGDVQPLDTRLWSRVRDELGDSFGCILQLEEHQDQVGGFRFEYHGRPREDIHLPGFVSTVTFWLPTEYLEQQGPERVRKLAMALARELPLASGYASLAFNFREQSKPALQFVRELCFRYPGMDVPHLGATSMELGEKVRGAYWLNFYGQPLLGQLGGVEGLRARLTLPEVSIEELGIQKVLVSLGSWPEAGDVEQRNDMRPYRALARVLEPFIHEGPPGTPENIRRWRRRFLD